MLASRAALALALPAKWKGHQRVSLTRVLTEHCWLFQLGGSQSRLFRGTNNESVLCMSVVVTAKCLSWLAAPLLHTQWCHSVCHLTVWAGCHWMTTAAAPSLINLSLFSCSGWGADQFNRTRTVCAAGYICGGHPEGCWLHVSVCGRDLQRQIQHPD